MRRAWPGALAQTTRGAPLNRLQMEQWQRGAPEFEAAEHRAIQVACAPSLSQLHVTVLAIARRARQLDLDLRDTSRWGGRRADPGRKRGLDPRDPHRARAPFAARFLCHPARPGLGHEIHRFRARTSREQSANVERAPGSGCDLPNLGALRRTLGVDCARSERNVHRRRAYPVRGSMAGRASVLRASGRHGTRRGDGKR